MNHCDEIPTLAATQSRDILARADNGKQGCIKAKNPDAAIFVLDKWEDFIQCFCMLQMEDERFGIISAMHIKTCATWRERLKYVRGWRTRTRPILWSGIVSATRTRPELP